MAHTSTVPASYHECVCFYLCVCACMRACVCMGRSERGKARASAERFEAAQLLWGCWTSVQPCSCALRWRQTGLLKRERQTFERILSLQLSRHSKKNISACLIIEYISLVVKLSGCLATGIFKDQLLVTSVIFFKGQRKDLKLKRSFPGLLS